MFTTHFYDDKIDDVAVSYLVSEIIIQVGFCRRLQPDTASCSFCRPWWNNEKCNSLTIRTFFCIFDRWLLFKHSVMVSTTICQCFHHWKLMAASLGSRFVLRLMVPFKKADFVSKSICKFHFSRNENSK